MQMSSHVNTRQARQNQLTHEFPAVKLHEIPSVARASLVAPRPTVPLDGRAPCLVVMAGEDEGLVFKLPSNGEVTIGRYDNCGLRLSDTEVSRRHARITCSGQGFTVEDLGSRNGTFVNGERAMEHQLAAEDFISVGPKTFLKFTLLHPVEEDHLQRMRAAALLDPLTGLHNRRSFDERLRAEWAASRRYVRPLSLLLIDIDDFKRINDTLGHGAGDRVLYSLGQTLREGVRMEDSVFRYGGEEVAVLARETLLGGAIELGERLRAATASHITEGIQVTISIGVAELAQHMTTDQFFDCADRRLYIAKMNGKNRVVAFDV